MGKASVRRPSAEFVLSALENGLLGSRDGKQLSGASLRIHGSAAPTNRDFRLALLLARIHSRSSREIDLVEILKQEWIVDLAGSGLVPPWIIRDLNMGTAIAVLLG